MNTILTCITQDHDLLILSLAAVTCIVGGIVTMRLFGAATRTAGSQKAAWVFMTAVACGATIWTTHFIAMLGYVTPASNGYDPTATLASLFIALAFSLVGVALASITRHDALVVAGSAVIGFGISVMHFTGMLGYEVSGTMAWDPGLVAAGIIVGAFMGILSTTLVTMRGRLETIGAPLALVLAICGMHFTAMSAMTIQFEPSFIAVDRLMDDATIALFAFGLVILILGTGACTYLVDVRSQRDQIRHLDQLARRDALTGLPNRLRMIEMANAYTETCSAQGTSFALLAIDLDRFKDVNDTHGHGTGDSLLQAVAHRAMTSLQKGEFLARFGGDEFVALKSIERGDEAVEFAERLVAAFSLPVDLPPLTLSVGASVGISIFDRDGATFDDLMSRADLALYRAKANSNQSVCFYDRGMDDENRKRQALSLELRSALDRKELELHYQPQYRVADGTLLGFEALIRWRHPSRGMVSPADFVPVAEETGMIIPIGAWVLHEACRTVAGWPAHVKIAVNVAPAQLLSGCLLSTVEEALRESGLDARRLEIEITESTIISDQEAALQTVEALKAIGVSVAMDDYGSGYSSLSMLRTFPFDKIKIDRSFIDDVIDNPQSAAIVKATLVLARSLGIPVVAEGVETQAHMDFLREERCEEAQGFLLGRPAPVEKAERLFSPQEAVQDQIGRAA